MKVKAPFDAWRLKVRLKVRLEAAPHEQKKPVTRTGDRIEDQGISWGGSGTPRDPCRVVRGTVSVPVRNASVTDRTNRAGAVRSYIHARAARAVPPAPNVHAGRIPEPDFHALSSMEQEENNPC